ncbi:NUDIX domain-containing protein [Paenibacillus hamazuiensis]|uniref:NUDIX domain-containing protein n=1 Tax=Paenibacillus hamazuiensis TaxID=2936508 RepID=UPI00200D67DF|nr:NUDIX domain-containing protein [Paenibacillus hamazuiensis]
MSGKWSESYVGQLRQWVGHRKLIVPSVRAVIFNERGEALFIRRRGDGSWALPAGAMELGESIFQCLQREVKEETGLDVHRSTLITIYTGPQYSIKNSFGDEYQGFEFLFRVEEWSGNLEKETDETAGASFFPFDRLPGGLPGYWADHHKEVVEDVNAFRGAPFIK